MVIFTPKKLLRYPKCISKLEDFGPGTRFEELLDDSYVSAKSVQRLLLCSGKIYYDLLEKQQEDKRKDIAIIRIEQLYPVPITQLRNLVKKYNHIKEWYWVQEEPRNMGPWGFVRRVIDEIDLKVISRSPSPSPASGYNKTHTEEQNRIIENAFATVEEMISPH